MYLTTTLASLPPTTSNFSSIQNLNIQRKPLPPLPIPQLHGQQQQQQQKPLPIPQFNLQPQRDQQVQFTACSRSLSSERNNSTTKSSIIISKSLLEQLPLERTADFASHMTCFLWFGDYMVDPHSSMVIHFTAGSMHRRFNEYKPRDAFKKFCRDVITATQVSNSVILLSLLYIYRMKTNNPAIKGQNGSEYRTFTVALMLANKFLDDNTYTNKTWSEVTNIPVSEINTMEMEFLSSLNYQLYVSEQQYFDWVREMDNFVTKSEDFNNDDNGNSDGSISASHSSQQIQYTPQQYIQSRSQSMMVQQSHQPPILLPTSTGFKRSAEQAFVDGMMVSPPKRTNIYPVYSSQQQLVVQSQPQQVYSQSIYPTPPSSNNSLQSHRQQQQQRLAYYSNNSSSSSSNMMFRSGNSQYDARQSYSTNVNTRNTSQFAVDPVNVLYAGRVHSGIHSNIINARSTSSGFQMNNLSFPTTVV